MGVTLVCMPGIEKRFARYPYLCSLIGHEATRGQRRHRGDSEHSSPSCQDQSVSGRHEFQQSK